MHGSNTRSKKRADLLQTSLPCPVQIARAHRGARASAITGVLAARRSGAARCATARLQRSRDSCIFQPKSLIHRHRWACNLLFKGSRALPIDDSFVSMCELMIEFPAWGDLQGVGQEHSGPSGSRLGPEQNRLIVWAGRGAQRSPPAHSRASLSVSWGRTECS
jgi:hypothetical protein